MQKAYEQSLKAFNIQEVPIGAIIVDKEGRVVARAYNQVEKLQTQTVHAELAVIKKASKKIKNWRLEGMTLYVTVQPCMMCLGAIYLSRISRVVYGVESPKYGFVYEIKKESGIYKNLHTLIQCIEYRPAQELLKKFFQEKRRRDENKEGGSRQNKTRVVG